MACRHRIVNRLISFHGRVMLSIRFLFPDRLVGRACCFQQMIGIALAMGLLDAHLFAVGAETASPNASFGQARTGVLVEVPHPLAPGVVDDLVVRLSQAEAAAQRTDSDGPRPTIVLKWSGARDQRVELEHALKLARLISGSSMQRIRVVSWIDTDVVGHEVLPILASDAMLVSPDGSIGDATLGESTLDETIALNYQAIAKRRGLLVPSMIDGLVDPSVEVARVTLTDGTTSTLSAEELESARQSGKVASESIWSLAEEPMSLDADELRIARAAIAIVNSNDEVADALELARLRSVRSDEARPPVGTLLSIVGSISPQRIRRWSSNLNATIEKGETNTWMIEVDSPGGHLQSSAALAAVLADPGPLIDTVGGVVVGQARGDAALIAVATKPLVMTANSTLGGDGGASMTPDEIERQSELIRLIAASTNRSETLLRGLLAPDTTIYEYTHRQTGRIRYATVGELTSEFGEERLEDVWKRGPQIDLRQPLSPARAIALGLADGQVTSLADGAAGLGLPSVPDRLRDRGLVRWVEQIGRNNMLAFILLLIGFMMLSTEMSAPGLGVPGFLAMVCFAFFFWAKFLAGTAEWLELVAFGLGLACLAIEVFVLPGFGIFGVGGMALTVLGVVLMSQTFVIPRNAYQFNEIVRGLSIAMASLVGILIGVVSARLFLPKAALATGLSMGAPDESLDQVERVARYEHLLGQTGVAITPLRPSGKGRFGDAIVAVISDAKAIESGESVRVLDVRGNRVVVEEVNS